MQTTIDNPQSTLLSLYDAVTDSPVYRSSTLHFDEQLDLLEKWLELLTKYMKQYVDKLNKFNLETNLLCKKVIPVGIDDSMIDPNFTGAVIKSFSDALQTTLAFKTKLVSDLEDNFIQPLQSFVKTNLKEFKEFRKQHEKSLERYDSQLLKYTSQSKTKEASAVREEAFRLFETRKAYTRMSGQHVVRILHFRSLLEHFLVERFSLATTSHLKDFEGGSDSWSKLQSSLTSWKQWLLDDKDTCNYQLNKLQTSRISLENKYLAIVQPPRDLEKYTPANASQMGLNNRHSLDYASVLKNGSQQSYKWGYLFIRGARGYWNRRWFFLYDGSFGSCNVNPSTRHKGTITMGDRVSLLLCDIKPLSDIDKRFCFEVMCAHQPSFVLQAETEVEMREWMTSFEKAKRLMLQTEQLDFTSGTATINSAPTTDTESPTNLLLDNTVTKSKATTQVDELPALSANNTTTDLIESEKKKRPSIVMLSTSPENDQQSLNQSSTSLTPLLVWEASRASMSNNNTMPTSAPTSPATQSFSGTISLDTALSNEKEDNLNTTSTAAAAVTNNNTSSSWGIPWALVPSMFQGGSTDDIVNELPPTPGTSPNVPAVTDADGHQVIWPTRVDDSNVPKVDLVGYPLWLDARNRELRHLFGGVGSNEVVLSAFIGLLKKKPLHDTHEISEPEVPPSPTVASNQTDNLEHEFVSQLTSTVKDPSSNYGYSYTGRGFITQETFWFYSCVLMTCVNTVAIRLRDIKTIRLIRDPSVTNIGTSSNLALAIDLAGSCGTNDAQSPLIFTTLMDDIEVVAEKLKFAVSNAKQTEPEALQITYDVIHSLSAAIKKNNANNQKTIIKTVSSADPIRSASDITSNGSTVSLLSSSSASSLLEPLPTKSSDHKKKSKTPRKQSAPVQPKSGALAAAMMAATVAGGSGFFDARKGIQEESRNILRNKKSKVALVHQEEIESTVPLPNSTVHSSVVNVPSKLADIITLETPAKVEDVHAPPESFNAPAGPVSCQCDSHLDKLEVEIEVPISAKHLYYILFAEDNPDYIDAWEKKTTENKSKDLSMTPWETVDGKRERTLKYIIPVNNAMVKLKEAEVVEKQVLEKKEDYLRYIVLTSTKTAQLPYADAFVPYVKYCITWVDKNRSKLSCYTGVKFLKNILVKGIVNKAAMKGMSENLAVFMPIVKREASKRSHKKRSDSKEKLDQVSLRRGGTIRRPSSKVFESEQMNQLDESSGWYGYVEPVMDIAKDLFDGLPDMAKIGTAVVLVLWILYSWLFSGSDRTSINVGSNQPLVASRAVYLRDINEGLLDVDIKPAYGESETFRLFLESKLTNRTLGTTHQWFSAQHHHFAVDILFSRERLAMLRHDTLILFQLVNEIDAQLLENEYTNWLMDIRLQCRLPEVDYLALRCDDVKRQLRSFPIDSYQRLPLTKPGK
ncbi:hypothetical protein EDC94DRAFT_536683 [Helicostylum pulchrum]|uniref:Uncharacterized protein n=1 Tax=Helicostylum pulchrum TaxID=562976 RepID=A0ABP9YAN2_9FUNG|nr:hypothetical protein EDC94DRAFT_536683 [Helicostylum pulchrum]